jgi:hypothetical protein
MFLVGDVVKNIFTQELGIVVSVNHRQREPYMVRYGETHGRFATGLVPQRETWLALTDIRGG